FLTGHLSGLLFLLFGFGHWRLASRFPSRFFRLCLLGRRLRRRLLGPLRYRRSFLGFGSLLGLGFPGYGLLGLGLLSLGFLSLGLLSFGLFARGLLGFGFNGLLGFDSLLGRCDLLGLDRSLGFLSPHALQSLPGLDLLVWLGGRHAFRAGLLRRFLCWLLLF